MDVTKHQLSTVKAVRINGMWQAGVSDGNILGFSGQFPKYQDAIKDAVKDFEKKRLSAGLSFQKERKKALA